MKLVHSKSKRSRRKKSKRHKRKRGQKVGNMLNNWKPDNSFQALENQIRKQGKFWKKERVREAKIRRKLSGIMYLFMVYVLMLTFGVGLLEWVLMSSDPWNGRNRAKRRRQSHGLHCQCKFDWHLIWSVSWDSWAAYLHHRPPKRILFAS